MFAATASAWSIAFCTDSSRMRAPRYGKDAQSPAAQTQGALVWPRSSTVMPLSTASPAACASAMPGMIPMPTITKSAGRWRPSARSAPVTRPSPVRRDSPTPSITVTPCDWCSARIASAVSGAATRPRMRGAASTTVTSSPFCAATAAASSPIYPPPTITTRRPGWNSPAIASMSASRRTA